MTKDIDILLEKLSSGFCLPTGTGNGFFYKKDSAHPAIAVGAIIIITLCLVASSAPHKVLRALLAKTEIITENSATNAWNLNFNNGNFNNNNKTNEYSVRPVSDFYSKTAILKAFTNKAVW